MLVKFERVTVLFYFHSGRLTVNHVYHVDAATEAR